MRTLLLVADPDHAQIRELGLPVEMVSLRLSETGTPVCGDGAAFLPEALTAEVLGAISTSEAGRELIREVLASWQDRTGTPPPPEIDLAASADPHSRHVQALHRLSELLRERTEARLRHNAQLLEMLSELRVEHEKSTRLLRTMRSFIADTLETTRWLSQANGPLPLERAPHLELPPQGHLRQRIAASSMGLSDIAIFLPDQDLPERGHLHVELLLDESAEIVSSWALDAAKLSTGWVRLSLIDALDDDEQTPYLRLSWEADRPLSLGGGVFHPDPVYCAEIDNHRCDRILAHRLWKHTPGSRPPMPEDGHWSAGPLPSRFYVDPLRLSAIASSGGDDLKYFGESGALQVHPRAGRNSAARLPGAVQPGVRLVRATIAGRHPSGPNIEYALATAPTRPVRELPELIQACEQTRRISDWVGLSGDREDELELILPKAAEESLDLYLITRLAPNALPAYAWATFRDIWIIT